jgi:hypothetical protein
MVVTSTPDPTQVPEPVGTSYGVFVTTNTDDLSAYHYVNVNSDGSFELAGLSYGDYQAGWFYPDINTRTNYAPVTVNAANIPVDVYIYPV